MAPFSGNVTAPKAEMPSRPHLLITSAAEFLENRADDALGSDLAEVPTEFFPEQDRFVLKAEVPAPDYFKESEIRMLKFQETLDAFKNNLIKRKVAERFDVEIKECGDYTFNDVLKIAQEVQQKHQDADKVGDTMGRIRKFFRSSGRNASTCKKLLAFVPSDAYGSVICGGFTIILSALERTETLRMDMYEAMGSIPKTLRKIHDLMDVHYKSEVLKYCADSVLVAIFVVLELIIRELTGSTTKKFAKLPFKGDTYGSQIDDAIKALEASVNDFEAEARLCDSRRFGQIDTTTEQTFTVARKVDATTEATNRVVCQVSTGIGALSERVEQQQAAFHQNQEQTAAAAQAILDGVGRVEDLVKGDAQGVKVYNNVYIFLSSNPNVDTRTGLAVRQIARSATPLSFSLDDDGLAGSLPLSSKDAAIADAWLAASGKAHKVAAGDLLACLGDLEARPDLAEQDRVAAILASAELRAWLGRATPGLLVVELPPRRAPGPFSAASHAAAVLVRAAAAAAPAAVLYHFCEPRATDPRGGPAALAGEAGLLVSLVAQALAYVARHDVHVDLGFLEADAAEDVRDDPAALFRLFKKLLRRLPPKGFIFIVLDAVWRLGTGAAGEEDGVLRKIVGLVRKEDLAVKLLVAEPSYAEAVAALLADSGRRKSGGRGRNSTAAASESRVHSLYVPESVDGGRHGFNTDWVEEEMAKLMREYESTSQSSSCSDSDESE